MFRSDDASASAAGILGGRKGGITRAARLSSERRSEIARAGAMARLRHAADASNASATVRAAITREDEALRNLAAVMRDARRAVLAVDAAVREVRRELKAAAWPRKARARR